MEGFKAYDIRGVYNKDFNKEDVYKLGFFLPRLYKANKILVGRDKRLSSDEIFESLSRGITDAGCDVYNIGYSTTPMVYFATGKHDFHTSVQITASHNAKEYNGFKVSGPEVLPIGYNNGLNKIKSWVENEPVKPAKRKGEIHDFPVKEEYLEFLKRYIHPEIQQLNIGVDCSNGMAAFLIKEILGDLPHYIHDTADGNFPGHDPNPLKEESREDIVRLVKENQYDAGIIFDGDADRVMFIDEKGQFISPDLMIALMGHYFLKNKPNERVLQDIRSSKSIKEYLKQFSAEIHTWRVGRAFAAPRLKEINGLYGGELAGHYYFRDFFYSDSGFLATLIVLDVISEFKKQGVTLSELISTISNYVSSGELNFQIENKQKAMQALVDHFSTEEEPLEIMDFDGYRLEFKHWWFNVRPSNTEPYLRVILEADSSELLDEKTNDIKAILNQID